MSGELTVYTQDLIKQIALDIGKEVSAHIERMYPDAVTAASSTFLLSVRNCTYNEIMAALVHNNEYEIISRLKERAISRKQLRAMYKKIRNNEAKE